MTRRMLPTQGRRPGLPGAWPALALLIAALASPAAAQSPLGTPLPEKPLGSEVEDEAETEAFVSHQLTFERVREARTASENRLRMLFRERGLSYPADAIYLRVFKHERVMEVWARGAQDSAFALVREYPVCALPGQLGPKRRLGDFQVPEGFYYIDRFNPESNYHLSLRVSYPNLADRMRREAVSLGGDIYVHGGCETVGCVPIENENIQEVYWLATQAMGRGQAVIPIHIFPARMDDEGLDWLRRVFQPGEGLEAFWENLAEGYAYFERTNRVPWVTIAQDGRYTVPAAPALASADGAGEQAPSAAGPAGPHWPGPTPHGQPDLLVGAPLAIDSMAVPVPGPRDTLPRGTVGSDSIRPSPSGERPAPRDSTDVEP